VLVLELTICYTFLLRSNTSSPGVRLSSMALQPNYHTVKDTGIASEKSNEYYLSEQGLQTMTDHGTHRHTGGTTVVFQKGRRAGDFLSALLTSR